MTGRGKGLLAAAVLAGCLCLLTGCGLIDAAAVQTGMKKSPYYQLGDTTWEHGGIEEYYFNQIPSELNEIYRELYERIRNHEDSAQLYANVPIEDFWTAYYSVINDHPEFFWVGSDIEAEQSTFSGKVVGYKLGTTVEESRRAFLQEKLEQAADAVIASIPADATDYQKIKAVYEYLIDTTDYADWVEDSQNVQSALLKHVSVCAGYSRAFQYILHRMGMFCTYVTGKTNDGVDHAWNIVRLGDRYYHVDVTWGDPLFVGLDEGTNVRSMNYNYLCCSDAEISRNHIPEPIVPLPVCDDDSYNYYRLNGMYYDTFDYDTIYQALMNSVWNENESIVMKFGDRSSYDTAVRELFQNGMLQDPCQYLMDIYGTGSWNYSYHLDDDFYLITIYWK